MKTKTPLEIIMEDQRKNTMTLMIVLTAVISLWGGIILGAMASRESQAHPPQARNEEAR